MVAADSRRRPMTADTHSASLFSTGFRAASSMRGGRGGGGCGVCVFGFGAPLHIQRSPSIATPQELQSCGTVFPSNRAVRRGQYLISKLRRLGKLRIVGRLHSRFCRYVQKPGRAATVRVHCCGAVRGVCFTPRLLGVEQKARGSSPKPEEGVST